MAMDDIVKKSTNQQHVDNSQEDQVVLDKQPRRDQGHSYDTRSKNGQTEKKESFFQKTKNVFSKSAPTIHAQTVSPSDQYQYQFAVNDPVMIQTQQDEAIHGIVRWTGPIRLSKKSNVPLVIAVGIETVSTCNSLSINTQGRSLKVLH